jgi:hypothetical protein
VLRHFNVVGLASMCLQGIDYPISQVVLGGHVPSMRDPAAKQKRKAVQNCGEPIVALSGERR